MTTTNGPAVALVTDADTLPVPFRLTAAGDLAAALEALYTEHGVTMLEMPEDGPHFGSFLGYYAVVSGLPVMVFPQHQNLAQRLTVAHGLLAAVGERGAA
ncbi:hypothetical protein [Streptomyces boninensis]|uniref:hypothetical protein n=1 Tax=Streptomyces boninensis TaxID=2039455 RepID=UPI003B21C63D